MRKTVLLTIMLMLGIVGMRAERNWDVPLTTAYSYHAVVYATVVNSNGNQVGSLGDNTVIGAFIGDKCRAIGKLQVQKDNGSDVYIYTFRIGVNSNDAKKTVNFVIKGSSGSQVELSETQTVSGGDETFNEPSNPIAFKFNPVKSIDLKEQLLTVRVGEEITQYIKHLYALNPADATVKDVTYSVPDGSNMLRKNADGTITAISTGDETVTISHSDINNHGTNLKVSVVNDIPKSDDFKIINNPLTVQLPDYELQKVNILDKLTGNVSASGSAPTFPDSYTWAEGPKVTNKILTFYTDQESGNIREVIADKYGTTRVEWTYSVTSAGFNNDGTYNAQKTYTATYGFDLNIVQALSKFEAHGFRMGINDENATIKITTVPANYILDEKLIKWSIPDVNGTPIVKIGEHIAGKNEWKVEPLALNSSNTITVQYENLSDTANVQVLQRVDLDEGWHWISLFADQLDGSQTKALMTNAREIRSQEELLYNDPHYGFFGPLNKIDCRNTYKVYVKGGKTINFLLPKIDNYAGEKEFDSDAINEGWNWMGFPYCFSHSIDEVLKNASFEDGTRIVSKEAFAEVSSGKWTGTLQTIVPGEGYLIYSPSYIGVITFPAEGNLAKVQKTTKSSTKRALSAVRPAAWKYKSTRFANNMTIIAKASEALDENRYSIGAFVGDECRGEGEIIDGKIFITVHGESGETVKFKLHDSFSDECVELPEQVNFTDMYGSLNAPLPLTTPATTAIDEIVVSNNMDLEGMEIYTLSGQRVNADKLEKGIYIVRSKTVTRKLIKK